MIPGKKHPRRHMLRMDEGLWTTLRILHGIRGGSFAATVRFVLELGADEYSRRLTKKGGPDGPHKERR